MIEWQQRPHSRLNQLTGEWVLVSPHRAQRPWQGLVDPTDHTPVQPYDPDCYLCPGNLRFTGSRNPQYTDTFAFDNDFPALLPDTPAEKWEHQGVLVARGSPGIARVVCFSPRHDLTIPRMNAIAAEKIVHAWCDENDHVGARQAINYVQIFENRGQMMGTSNPHPHSQIWATHLLPNEIRREQAAQRRWLKRRNQCLLCEYLALERNGERVVAENTSFVALVPFWAEWPFEVLIISARHAHGLTDLHVNERSGIADILRQIGARYDNLFNSACPYSMGFHQQPCDGSVHEEWHFHVHFLPPVLRSATVRKFKAGYELLAMPHRDITPEAAAGRLRALPDTRY